MKLEFIQQKITSCVRKRDKSYFPFRQLRFPKSVTQPSVLGQQLQMPTAASPPKATSPPPHPLWNRLFSSHNRILKCKRCLLGWSKRCLLGWSKCHNVLFSKPRESNVCPEGPHFLTTLRPRNRRRRSLLSRQCRNIGILKKEIQFIP